MRKLISMEDLKHEEHYKAKNQLIAPIRKKYEKYNEELEVAVEENRE